MPQAYAQHENGQELDNSLPRISKTVQNQEQSTYIRTGKHFLLVLLNQVKA
jgi:hypothetical protein